MTTYGHSTNPGGRPPVVHLVDGQRDGRTFWLCGKSISSTPRLSSDAPAGMRWCQVCAIYDRTGGRRPVLYVVRLDGGSIKIGRTAQLGHRLLGLHATLLALADGGPADESRLVRALEHLDPELGAERFHSRSLDEVLGTFCLVTAPQTEAAAS